MMKNKGVLVVFSVLLWSSCKVMSPKSYEGLLNTRDSLAKGWNESQIRNGNLEDEIAKLKSDTVSLRRRLSALQSNLSSSNTEVKKLSAHLEEREQHLKEVEDILHQQEAAGKALKEKLQQALLGFQEHGLSVDMHGGKVYVLLADKLLFPSGSIQLDSHGKEALQELAKVLNTQPDINIAVEGHTDNQRVRNLGQIKDNWDLSVLRSTSVVRYLTLEEGVDPTRLTATGKSEYTPVDTIDTPEARASNRRIEIVLSPKLDQLYELIK